MAGELGNKPYPPSGDKFDPNGSGYDYATAKAHGMGPNGDGTAENAGHWGSVAPAPQQYNLPEGSHMILKGRNHPTFNKAVEAENARGSAVRKVQDRWFSIPR